MSAEESQPDDSRAARMMRRAILHELQQPPDLDDEPVDNLQKVARALLKKAGDGDLSAIKEVCDRIDGRTPMAPPEAESLPTHVRFSWKEPV